MNKFHKPREDSGCSVWRMDAQLRYVTQAMLDSFVMQCLNHVPKGAMLKQHLVIIIQEDDRSLPLVFQGLPLAVAKYQLWAVLCCKQLQDKFINEFSWFIFFSCGYPQNLNVVSTGASFQAEHSSLQLVTVRTLAFEIVSV